MSTSKTFEAHGLTWTSHTPGDPMPCDGLQKAMVLMRFELAENIFTPSAVTGDTWDWSALPNEPHYEIIGWRYADEQQRPSPDQDELATAIQKLTSTPGISAESLALIEAAKAVQSGSMSFSDALNKLHSWASKGPPP